MRMPQIILACAERICIILKINVIKKFAIAEFDLQHGEIKKQIILFSTIGAFSLILLQNIFNMIFALKNK
jgi:hypothetical protein